MNSIFEGLADLQSPEAARTLSRELGTDEAATQNALAAALPALLGALSRSGTSPEGAQSLLGALDRDHDGSILDDLLGALGGARSGSDARTYRWITSRLTSGTPRFVVRPSSSSTAFLSSRSS